MRGIPVRLSGDRAHPRRTMSSTLRPSTFKSTARVTEPAAMPLSAQVGLTSHYSMAAPLLPRTTLMARRPYYSRAREVSQTHSEAALLRSPNHSPPLLPTVDVAPNGRPTDRGKPNAPVESL